MRMSELYSRNATALFATSCRSSRSISSTEPSSLPRGARQTVRILSPLPTDADVVGARQVRRAPAGRAGGSDVGVIRGAHGDRQIEVAILEDRRALAVPALHHVGDAVAQMSGMKKPPLNRMASGCAPLCSETPPDGA